MPIDVPIAFQRWARTVFGAPRRLETQITAVEEHDEVLTRVATEVVRRDLFEERVPAHRRARRDIGRVDPSTIDPFRESIEELRSRTEHTERCGGCGGGGVTACPSCGGGGRQRCGNCSGSGQVLKVYKKSSKYVNCGVCRGGGTVACGGCGATGSVTCQGCAGSGEQLVWWAYRERVAISVQIHPDSTILIAHRHLRESRFLRPTDLGAFTPFVTIEATGPISGDQISPEDEALRLQLTPALNAQLERIRSQQFLRFGVLRRDVRYEMCGAAGHVVLSGTTLVGSTTPDAVRPIRRRLILWGIAAFVLYLFGSSYHSFLSGASAYFQPVNRAVAVVLMVGAVAAILAAGGALRALRPGFGWWPIGLFDRVAAGVFAGAVLLCPLIAYVGRPRPAEAHAAVVAGDLDRARVVVEALVATRPASEVADVANELELAEAARLSGDARLAKLDAIAARGGSRASEAREKARRERIDAAQTALAAGRSADAIAMLERWAPALADSPEAAEIKARAFDVKSATCADEWCRLVAARSAKAAHETPERDAALRQAREKLVAALAEKAPDGDVVARVRALRGLAALAKSTQASPNDDGELIEKARAASSWSAAELAKVVLIGAPAAAVELVLERPENAGARSGVAGWPELKGVAVHVAQAGGRCVGLYVVGAAEGARALSGKEAGVQRLLAQATGKTGAAIHERKSSAKTHEVTKWVEGGTPVTARWNGGTLMEVRIGEASP